MPSDRHVLLIAVGPVQPFIAAARKIRDLWQGSRMLSEMSKTVARTLADQRCELIFPAPAGADDLAPNSKLGVANKILALTPAGAVPADLVAKVKDSLRIQREAQFAKVQADLGAHIDRTRFEAQRDDYGEFYAVWVACDPAHAGDYDRARRQAERLLAGRKLLRDFAPPSWHGAGLRKNGLDGARETVFPEDSVAKTSPLVRQHLIKFNEHLDALGLVKRWHGLHPAHARALKFDTLSDVALVPYLAGIAHPENARLQTQLAAAQAAIAVLDVGKNERDTLLFENRLNVWLKEQDDSHQQAKGRAALAVLHHLYAMTGEPPAYACILHGDGDHMGGTLDGLKARPHHQAFSRALAGFAGDVGGIVERHGGSLIFSGADDVLAFLPLHTALSCVAEIRERFAVAMEAAARQIAPGNPAQAFGDAKPTFSAGLVIVHHLEALYLSLDKARRAEALAKNRFGRDALAIIQSIRGGEQDLVIGGHWDATGPAPGALPGVTDRLRQLVALLQPGRIPGRLARQLRGMVQSLQMPHGDFSCTGTEPLRQVVAAEALRIVRHKEESGAGDELEALLRAQGDIRAFSDELVVAQQIARAGRIAAGDFA